MANYIRKLLKSKLAKISPTNDIILTVTDTMELYINDKQGNQNRINDIIPVNTEEELANLNKVTGKIYIIANDLQFGEDKFLDTMYYYNGSKLVPLTKELASKVLENTNSISDMKKELNSISDTISIRKHKIVFDIKDLVVGKIPNEACIDAYIFRDNEKISLKSVTLKRKSILMDQVKISVYQGTTNDNRTKLVDASLPSTNLQIKTDITDSPSFNNGFISINIDEIPSTGCDELTIILDIEGTIETN